MRLTQSLVQTPEHTDCYVLKLAMNVMGNILTHRLFIRKSVFHRTYVEIMLVCMLFDGLSLKGHARMWDAANYFKGKGLDDISPVAGLPRWLWLTYVHSDYPRDKYLDVACQIEYVHVEWVDAKGDHFNVVVDDLDELYNRINELNGQFRIGDEQAWSDNAPWLDYQFQAYNRAACEIVREFGKEVS